MRRRLLLAAMIAAAPPAAAQAPSGDLVVVANKQAASVTVLDAATGRAVATLPVGQGPHEVAASPDGRWAVVTNYGAQAPGSSLSVIDLDRLQVVRTIDLGEYRRPHGIAFLPGGMRVAVTSEASQNVVIVDAGAGTVARAIPTGQRGSHMLAVSPDGRRIYTANIPSGTVSVLDVEAGTLLRTSEPIARVTEGIALSPDGRRLWIGSNEDHTVTVVDAATLAPVDTLPAPGFPYRAVAAADGGRVVVPNPMAATLRLFDARTLTEEAAIVIPPGAAGAAQPVGVALSADGRTAYVSLQDRSQVAVVDLASRAITGFWDVGAGPDGIAYARRR